jgi:hypothetical protein
MTEALATGVLVFLLGYVIVGQLVALWCFFEARRQNYPVQHPFAVAIITVIIWPYVFQRPR